MLKVNRNLLVKALEVTNLSLPKSGMEPLVKITAINNTMSFITTNVDLTTFYKIDNVKISKTFEICVPHADLKRFIAKLQGEEVVFRLVRSTNNNDDNNEFLYIQSNHTKTLIQTRSADIFPSRGIQKANTKYTSIKADVLLTMINKVITAVCTDEARWYINGILCDIKDNTLSCVSTDSHRLNVTTITLTDSVDDIKFVLPRRSLDAIKTFLANYGNLDIDIYYNQQPKQVVFVYDNYAIATCLVEGEFPDYKRVIPQVVNNNVICNSKHLITAINQVSASSSNNIVELNITAGDLHNNLQSKIELITKAKDTHIATTAKTLKTKTQMNCIANKDIKVNYNSIYLIDALNSCGSEDVNLCFTEPSKPLKIIPIAKDNQESVINNLCIIMPIKM